MIWPLTVEVAKPRARLKDQEEYQRKPQRAARMIRQLQARGVVFELVLAESWYGESKVNVVNVLDALNRPDLLAIRSKHALWHPPAQEVYQEPWQPLERTFSNGTTEVRDRAEGLYGKRHRKQYWLLTTAPETLPDNATSFGLACAPAVKRQKMGDPDGFRTGIEYGLKQPQDA